MALPLPVTAGLPDPIFAAIEAHKAALAAVMSQLDILHALEKELPPEKRQSNVDVWEELIIFDDDPRWIDSERAMHRLWDAESSAVIELVGVRPTTSRGVLALLGYAMDGQKDAEMWPQDLVSDDGERSGSWYYFLIENLAEVLPSMMGAARAI